MVVDGKEGRERRKEVLSVTSCRNVRASGPLSSGRHQGRGLRLFLLQGER